MAARPYRSFGLETETLVHWWAFEAADVCQRLGVMRLDEFGSAATERFDPLRSDLDLLVSSPSSWLRRRRPMSLSRRFAVPSKTSPLSGKELAAFEAKRDLAAELLLLIQEMKAGSLKR